MECFVSGRHTGKTWHLINLSHDTGLTIVARNEMAARAIEHQAREMGKPIPKPISYVSLAARPIPNRRVLVDEAQGVLDDALRAHVVAASIDGDVLTSANHAIGRMGLLELMRTWRKARKLVKGRVDD